MKDVDFFVKSPILHFLNKSRKNCYLYFCERYYMYFWKRHRCPNRYERVYIALCYNPHDYFQNFHNQGSMRLRFGIETKDHNIVPIFPPKHFVGTQPHVGEQGLRGTEDDRKQQHSSSMCLRTSVTLREALASLLPIP